MDVALVVIVVLAVVAVTVLRFQAAKKRREAFAVWAAKRGWIYSESDDSYADRFDGTPFGTGNRRRAQNVVVGQLSGRQVVAFDYLYETDAADSKGRRTTKHRYGIVAIALPALVPTLQVSQEGIAGTVVRAVGVKDIELENEDFNREFKVKGDDRKFASDVLHPQMMAFLMQSKGPAWRMSGGDLVSWSKGRLDRRRIDRDLAFLSGVIDQVPGFGWTDRGAASA